MKALAFVAIASVALFSATPAAAQTSVTTDASWQSCKVLLIGAVPCPLGSGTSAVPSPLPGGWAAGPWIRPAGGNPLSPNNSGGSENPTWQYGFGFQFNSTGVQAVTMNITRMQLDNYFRQSSATAGTAAMEVAGFFINGNAISFGIGDWASGAYTDTYGNGTYGGTPVNPNGQNWNKVFGINLSFNSQAGNNVFEVRTTGNGVNDGFAMAGALTVGQGGQVPEPASVALLGLGIVGLGAAARRRRTV